MAGHRQNIAWFNDDNCHQSIPEYYQKNDADIF